ncbi:MAG: cytidine deaminase [Nitrososphaeria archaeon]|nr:cytidine deaminase [Nitrososphaeria archaeon]NDB62384.1 cytidine deaminase [Nitrosopumilaceae archaeon]NDB91858.1 cytidine deaminase [Nitrososphaeria archaeon]NDF26151.1 cytidine deaminase [Nitrosopumilaceae archaeon]NDF46636.1 cytidine deaminase [Nitrosopumilaceae archaeon]
MKVIPIKTSRKQTSFDLYKDLIESIKEHVLETGDIIVISSKYVANSQGRTLDVAKTRPSSDGIELAKKYQMDSKFAEIVLRESDKTLGGVTGFVLTSSDHVLAPNAGIDKSNVKKGTIVLYPDLPYTIVENLRKKIFLEMGVHVGVILVDSRLMPARAGTVGVAIAVSGFEPVQDVRGQKDLDGNPLKVTIKATADNLATIANHKMGEGAESTPIVIIKESGTSITTRKIRNDEMAISSELCVYMRGFAN